MFSRTFTNSSNFHNQSTENCQKMRSTTTTPPTDIQSLPPGRRLQQYLAHTFPPPLPFSNRLHPVKAFTITPKTSTGWKTYLNTDESLITNMGSVAVRNTDREWIIAFSIKLQDVSTNLAEQLGLREGLELAWDK